MTTKLDTDGASKTAAPRRPGLIARCCGAVVIGLMSVAFCIAFAALVYPGEVSGFLGVAVPLSLVGAAIIAMVGWALHKLPVISQPQEIPALMVGSGAVIIAGEMGDAAGPTVFAFSVIAAMFSGLAVGVAGFLRLGNLARFMPYPVLAGFMAATGYMLFTGAVGLALDVHADIWHLTEITTPDAFARWIPWLGLGAILALAVRRIDSDLVLPAGIIIGALAFYVFTFGKGLSMDDASALGLLLGPFPESAGFDTAGLLDQVDWGQALSQAPIVLGVAGMTLVGTLLNMTGLEASMKRETHLDRDLKAVGASNIAAGITGAPVGYPMIGETLLAHRFGLGGLTTALSISACLLAVAFLGADVLALLPRGLFAAVIGFLGVDLLIEWLWEKRKGLHWSDRATIYLILAVAALGGFLEAIGLGIVLSVIIFVSTYAQLNPVLARSTLALQRSVTERPDCEAARLQDLGREVVILELSGFLFFGSAFGIVKTVREEIKDRAPSTLILSFARVAGIDISAQQALKRVAEDCANDGRRLIFCALPKGDGEIWSGSHTQVVDTLDDALELEETRLLTEHGPDPTADPAPDLSLIALVSSLPEPARQTVSLSTGEILFEAGDASQTIYVLQSGRLRAEITHRNGSVMAVARFNPGAVVGEIAYYENGVRTARVVCDREAELIAIDPNALETSGVDTARFHQAIARNLATRLSRTTRYVRQIST